MSSNILIYGSNGYTGDLIAKLSVEKNLRPVLAGRTESKIKPQAESLRLDYRIFALDDAAAVDSGLKDMAVVIHCAGPFSRTAKAMAEGCVRTKTHYLDITGEIDVFEAMNAMDAEASAAGVMLMPGTGFDIVPSDCLSAHMKRRLPSATRLTLVIQAIGKPSRGTATTMVENIHKGGIIRKDGELTPVPSAWKNREVDLGDGPTSTMTIPWGDVSTAYYSTGIPNIEVFMAVPKDLRRMAVLSRYVGWLLGSGPVQGLLKKNIQSGPPGPSDEERRTGHSLLLGEAEDDAGGRVSTRMRTPEGYTLTSRTALAIAERVVAGEAPAGFKTPSMAYGPDFIMDFDGVERTDL